MDAKDLLILESDFAAQLAHIDDVFLKLEERASGFNADDALEMQAESIAFQIHNACNAIEKLFRLIAAHFENQISDESRWQIAPLKRMTQSIPGVRPALLTKETFHLLDALRGFRHLFRHSYSAGVEPLLLQANLQKARQVHNLLHRDISAFLDQLRPIEQKQRSQCLEAKI